MLEEVHRFEMLYANQGKLDEAEKTYRRALEGREKALGRDYASTLELGDVIERCWTKGFTER